MNFRDEEESDLDRAGIYLKHKANDRTRRTNHGFSRSLSGF